MHNMIIEDKGGIGLSNFNYDVNEENQLVHVSYGRTIELLMFVQTHLKLETDSHFSQIMLNICGKDMVRTKS